jgi:O-antigen/teichoic acid export membrane protein
MNPPRRPSAIRRALANVHVRQAGVLYGSLIAALLLGILVSVINTRLLGPEQFGEYKLLQAIWVVATVASSVGVFSTGGLLLARSTSPQQERQLIGGMLGGGIVVAAGLTAIVVVVSFPLATLYGEKLSSVLRIYSPLFFVFVLQLFLQEALRATNRISRLAALNVLPPLIYAVLAMVVQRVGKFDLDTAVQLSLLSLGSTVVVLTAGLPKSFSGVVSQMREIGLANKSLGMQVYLAVLITTASDQLSQFTLAHFIDARAVGMFALAVTLAMPLAMIPNTIATTFFRRFANSDRIPPRAIAASIVLSLVSLVVVVAIVKPVVVFLYSEQFLDVVRLAYICAPAAVARGMGDFFNRHLLAHRKTAILRRNAWQLAVLSVCGYVVLVKYFGEVGAAGTKLLVDAAYLASMFTYYARSTRATKHE